MLELNARAFVRAVSLIERANSISRHVVTPFGGAPEDEIGDGGNKVVGDVLDDLKKQIDILDLPMTAKAVQRHRKELSKEVTLRDVGIKIQDVIDRLNDELEEVSIFCLEKNRSKYIQTAKPLFGAKVEAKFPGLAEDIEQSGKCLAFGLPTASVFHLMRCLERAVQALANELNIGKVEREWGKILSDIDKAIQDMAKGDERNAWSEARANLYHVKQAWRHSTMHPKKTYTPEQAIEVFEAMRVFMNHLCGLISADEEEKPS